MQTKERKIIRRKYKSDQEAREAYLAKAKANHEKNFVRMSISVSRNKYPELASFLESLGNGNQESRQAFAIRAMLKELGK